MCILLHTLSLPDGFGSQISQYLYVDKTFMNKVTKANHFIPK